MRPEPRGLGELGILVEAVRPIQTVSFLFTLPRLMEAVMYRRGRR